MTSLEAAWGDLADGRWEAARDAFAALLKQEETPEALEGSSWAAWWLDDADTVFAQRERAYHLYRQRRDAASAARMATWMAADALDFHGAAAVASGWLKRARRLLQPLDPGPDHGWLAFHEGYIAVGQGDADRAVELGRRAASLGRQFGVPDLEMLGLSLEGTVLVNGAAVEAGMACLDEAAAIALEGGAEIPISGAWACCFMVSACEAVRDYSRAFEWCDRIADFAERYGSRYMLAFCRAHYGEVSLWRGRWEEAERQFAAAVEEYARSRPAFLPGVLARFAELRRRQGRVAEAERLLEQAAGREAVLCSARLALDRGDARQAAELAERCLRGVPESRTLPRVAALELLVRACAQRGEQERAAAALEQLRALARRVGTEPLAAAASLAEGLLDRARGDTERARIQFENAVDRFAQCGAAYEVALARTELAATLALQGRAPAAAREARASEKTLADLGAEPAARRAREIARDQAGPQRADVTRRERQVLNLLCEGFTNRQIADRLSVSEHTIHRHVTNILRKLGLPSRTAAAAWAVRSGLVRRRTE